MSGGEAERGAWAPDPVSPAGLDVAQALAGIAALAPPPPVALPPPPAYDAEVAQLADMGFTDAARARRVLRQVGGRVEAAIGMLVNM